MARIVKDPEERKKELIETAEQLFIEKGYDQTLISDIVKKLGIAQGTFYYYFKSKDEILGTILEGKWEQFAVQIEKKLEVHKVNVLHKLQLVLGMLFSPIEGSSEQLFFKVLEDPGVVQKFHRQSDDARTKKLMPIIQRLVRESIEEKLIGSMQHPDEITEIIFHGINMYMHIYTPLFKDRAVFYEKMAALQELLERVLGIEKGSFVLFPRG